MRDIDDRDNIDDLDNIGDFDNIDDLGENDVEQRDQLTFISASFTAAAPNPYLGDNCGEINCELGKKKCEKDGVSLLLNSQS